MMQPLTVRKATIVHNDHFFFQMSSVISRYNVRNIALLALCIGSLLMLLFALGPQGIVPAHGMMSTNTIESSFENLNLRSSALPVPNVNGGQAAPGVSIATKTIQIMVVYVWTRKHSMHHQ